MNVLHFLLPGDINGLTGGYVYDRRILGELQQHGWQIALQSLSDTFPRPSAKALEDANATMHGIADDQWVVIDGLALGAMPEVVSMHAARLNIVALVHHPLALETGLSAAEAERLRESETAALRGVKHVFTTSDATARQLAGYDVQANRISVVRPGTDIAPLAAGSPATPPRLLCVATLTPRKGHDVLIHALHQLLDLSWDMMCVGSKARDPDTANRIQTLIDTLNLTTRVSLPGEVDVSQLNTHYQAADIFVLASHYEGYGMVFDEALARGLPIIATGGGAVVDTVPAAAGMLVPAGDAQALSDVIRQVLTDDALFTRLREGARAARDDLRSWSQAGVEFQMVMAGLQQ